jgi:hypothetical protein
LPCPLHCKPPPLVPARLPSLPAVLLDLPFCSLLRPFRLSPHVLLLVFTHPFLLVISPRDRSRVSTCNPALLLPPSPLFRPRFFPRATYLDHDPPRSCACALPRARCSKAWLVRSPIPLALHNLGSQARVCSARPLTLSSTCRAGRPDGVHPSSPAVALNNSSSPSSCRRFVAILDA